MHRGWDVCHPGCVDHPYVSRREAISRQRSADRGKRSSAIERAFSGRGTTVGARGVRAAPFRVRHRCRPHPWRGAVVNTAAPLAVRPTTRKGDSSRRLRGQPSIPTFCRGRCQGSGSSQRAAMATTPAGVVAELHIALLHRVPSACRSLARTGSGAMVQAMDPHGESFALCVGVGKAWHVAGPAAWGRVRRG